MFIILQDAKKSTFQNVQLTVYCTPVRWLPPKANKPHSQKSIASKYLQHFAAKKNIAIPYALLNI